MGSRRFSHTHTSRNPSRESFVCILSASFIYATVHKYINLNLLSRPQISSGAQHSINKNISLDFRTKAFVSNYRVRLTTCDVPTRCEYDRPCKYQDVTLIKRPEITVSLVLRLVAVKWKAKLHRAFVLAATS
jgi:hypothetical protein